MVTVPTDHSCVATDVWPVAKTIHLSQQMSGMFCIITTDYSAIATGYLTIQTDHSYVPTNDVAIDVWFAIQTIHFSQQMSDIFCIIATDYSAIATYYLTIPINHSCVTTYVWPVVQTIRLSQ